MSLLGVSERSNRKIESVWNAGIKRNKRVLNSSTHGEPKSKRVERPESALHAATALCELLFLRPVDSPDLRTYGRQRAARDTH